MKKQLIAVLLAFVMVITMLPASVFAAAALILAPESVSAELKTGTEIAVRISVSNNPVFAAGTVKASWDASALTLKSVKYSDLAPENIPVGFASDASSCVLSFGDYMTHENFKESGTFFTLIFAVANTAKAGDYPILLSDADIVSTDLKAVPTQLQAGCVSLTDKETDKNTLRLKVGTASAVITSTEQIKVPVSADINPGFSAGRVDVIWDYTVLKLTGIEFSEAAPDNGTPAIVSDGNQPVAIGDYLAKENITSTGTLFTLVFEKNEQAAAGTYPVMIASADMIDCTMKKIPVVLTAGAVILENETTATTSTTTTATTTTTTTTKDTSATTSTTKDTTTSVSKSTTTSSTTTATTTKKNTTTTASTTTPTTTTKKNTTTATAFLIGDINDDGEVSVEDAQLALIDYVNAMTGLGSSLTDKQKLAADVNGDREITVEDAQTILIYYVSNTITGETITWDELLGKVKPAESHPITLTTEFFFTGETNSERKSAVSKT